MPYVSVDFDDIDTYDLIDELESRGFTMLEDGDFDPDQGNEKLVAIFEALKIGQEDRAFDLMKLFLQDRLGVIIP